MIIAVDGESASGKGTLSKLLAKELNFAYLDTGLLYRAVAYLAQKKGVLNDVSAMVEIARNLKEEVFLQKELKGDDIASITSKIVAPEKEVRESLLQYQRNFGNYPKNKDGESLKGAVLDGRDVGTIIFPNADVKFFVSADLEVRATRRYLELKTSHPTIKLEDICESLRQRDENDKNRSSASLKKADDAIEINTTDLSIEEGLEFLLKHVRERLDC